jgi:hypothetical protein
MNSDTGDRSPKTAERHDQAAEPGQSMNGYLPSPARPSPLSPSETAVAHHAGRSPPDHRRRCAV